MADTDLQLKAIDALVHIHTAIKKAQLYPNADPVITKSIEVLYLHLLYILRKDAPLVFAEVEKKALLGEKISNQQEDETIHISVLLDILLVLGVKNVSFYKDLENEELHIFINLLTKSPKTVHEEVALPKLVEENKTATVEPDDKITEPVEKEKEIVPVLVAKDPEAVADEVGLPKLVEENKTAPIEPDDKVTEPIEREKEIVPDIVAKDPEAVAKEVGLPKLVEENKTATVEPDNKVTEPVEKEKEIVPDLDITEGQISESITEMKKVFIRLNAMDGAIASLPSEEQRDMVKRLSARTAKWIEMGTTVTPAYKEIYHRLQTLLQDFINHGYFAEANTIIDVFSKINNGTLKKDDKVREVSLEVLRNLASENNIYSLFKEININDNDKKTTEACQILAGFGDLVINKLLNVVRDSNDSKERIRIIHIIEKIGHAAIPGIKASISINAPWYYLRNMAYILGLIGNETSADTLRTLLLNKDKRVRNEAFKSIGQTGGNKKGSVLLSVLPQADQELKVKIIEMIGKIRCTEAVTNLLDMLKNKHLIAKDEQVSLQEKICNALGSIGSPEAIKTLLEIAEAKSILGIGSYPKEVKAAAERALANIKRKQEENQN